MSKHQQGSEYGLAWPDPALSRTVGEFIECLRMLKLWAGDPSFGELRRRCAVPASTLSDALNVKVSRLPRLEVVRAFVIACDTTPAYLDRWVVAWRALRLKHAMAKVARTPSGPSRWTIPVQSPRDLLHVIGRDDIIDRLDEIHRDHVAGRHLSPVVSVAGPSEVSASAVALFWAHQRTHAFPDGHLYLDLRRIATGPEHAGLPLLLRQLGVPEEDIPVDPVALAGLFRSITYDRQLLIVLDHVCDTDQVRPLLPGGPACYTLVTSSNQQPELVARYGVIPIQIAPLQPQEAEKLITSALGHDRIHHHLRALPALINLGRQLPAALSNAVASLAGSTCRSKADLITQPVSGE